jgi:hypothetical protein
LAHFLQPESAIVRLISEPASDLRKRKVKNYAGTV